MQNDVTTTARGRVAREVAALNRALQRDDLAAAEQHAAFLLGAIQYLRAERRLSVSCELVEVEP